MDETANFGDENFGRDRVPSEDADYFDLKKDEEEKKR